MQTLLVAFAATLVVTFFIVKSTSRHAHLSFDHDMSGPQKFHSRPVPRIGGLGILAGVVAAAAVICLRDWPVGRTLVLLLTCAMPTFLSGLVEDMTKNISPSRRMLFTMMSAVLGVFLLNAVIARIGWAPLDWLVTFPVASCAATVFTVCGVTNAVNIIDGFNGLASMCVMLMLAAGAVVAFLVKDEVVLTICLVTIAAVLGFFVWNFPRGLIFLGDGGAYFLGFVAAEALILLMQRNASVSPMFPLLVCIYPVVEVVFSIYRKKVIRKMSPGVPDGVHLHMLVYKRLTSSTACRGDARALTRRNSLTSPYLWALSAGSVIPAIIFWDDTLVLALCIVLFTLAYVTLYWRIVRFRTPRWMVARR